MLLSEVFNEQSIILNLEARTKEDALTELVDAIALARPELKQDEMLAVVRDRESKMNTGVGSGAAVPHGCYPGMNDIAGAIGISRDGIEYDAPDQKPVNVVFLMVMGESCREKHLRVLNRVAALINSGALSQLRGAKSPQEICGMLSLINLGT